MAKIKGWHWIEGRGRQDIMYANDIGFTLTYGSYSKDFRNPYTSKTHYVELSSKEHNFNRTWYFDTRKKAKENAFKMMKGFQMA